MGKQSGPARQDRRAVLKRSAAGAIGYAAAGVGLPATARAADTAHWPERPVRIVVPYAAGGTADTLGRLAASLLQQALHQPFIVENKAGAGGMIGSQMVAKSAPDGYTLVVSGIGSHVIAPVETHTYNPVSDFTHIAMLGGPPTALTIHPSLPVHDVRELVAYSLRNKDGISWASPGKGTHAHLLGELFWRVTGGRNTAIGYKGASPAIADLVSGQVQAAFSTFTTASAQIRGGRIKGLAVTSEARLADEPNLPTFAELGYPQLTAMTWFSLSGPAGMPPAIVERLNAEVRRGLATEAARKVLAIEAIETRDWDAPTFAHYLRSEVERWQPLALQVDRKTT